jgi:hypothetical protein
MAWLPREPNLRDAVLTLGDRWVLAGWLDGPGIDLEPVSDALNAPPFDALRTTPLAQVVLARAAGIQGPTDAGLQDLQRAALRKELGIDGDPVDALLARAADRLTDAAGLDLAAGGAVMAVQARRRYGACPDTPCQGLDRMDGVSAGARWHPTLARLARLWRVAALKDGVDGLDVARGTVRYPAAVVDLVDALIGAGATAPGPIVLLQRSPDSATWLALARAVGAEQATTWEDARAALHAFARAEATAARDAETDREVRELLDRVVKQLEP